jgi:hypothetical protein
MTQDLLKRLREAGNDYTVAWGSGELYDEAADEIERLKASLDRIRNGIATDRCDGDSEWAAGVNAACDNHRALVASGVKECGSNGTADCQSTAPEHRCAACPHGVDVPRADQSKGGA